MKRFEATGLKGALLSWYIILTLAFGVISEIKGILSPFFGWGW